MSKFTQFGQFRYSGGMKIKIFKMLRSGNTPEDIAVELNKPLESVKKHIISNREYYYGS